MPKKMWSKEARTWGERLRVCRAKRGWSLRELARQAGVAPATVHRAERNQETNASHFVAIVQALGVSLDDVVG